MFFAGVPVSVVKGLLKQSAAIFREFPDADRLVEVVPLNPIAKQFPTISNCHPHRNSIAQP